MKAFSCSWSFYRRTLASGLQSCRINGRSRIMPLSFGCSRAYHTNFGKIPTSRRSVPSSFRFGHHGFPSKLLRCFSFSPQAASAGYPSSPEQVPNPREKSPPVNGPTSVPNSISDEIGCLSISETAEINEMAHRIQSETGIELALVCLEDLRGDKWAKTGYQYTDETNSFEFAKQLMDQWGTLSLVA
jgi:hypothetical protein